MKTAEFVKALLDVDEEVFLLHGMAKSILIRPS